jgi:hypothetical protein
MLAENMVGTLAPLKKFHTTLLFSNIKLKIAGEEGIFRYPQVPGETLA